MRFEPGVGAQFCVSNEHLSKSDLHNTLLEGYELSVFETKSWDRGVDVKLVA